MNITDIVDQKSQRNRLGQCSLLSLVSAHLAKTTQNLFVLVRGRVPLRTLYNFGKGIDCCHDIFLERGLGSLLIT